MKKLMLSILVMLQGLLSFGENMANAQFLKANAAYDSANYVMAIQLYESLVSDQYVSEVSLQR